MKNVRIKRNESEHNIFGEQKKRTVQHIQNMIE